MSLDTILKIGKVLRNGSEKPMKHFRYVSQPPLTDDIVFLSVPVKEGFVFDWDNICVVPEKDREEMFYLRYKTSDQDRSVEKYVFGDIFYAIEKVFDIKGKLKDATEKGNYIIQKNNAFDNASKVREEYVKSMVECFYKDGMTKDDKKKIVDEIKEYLSKVIDKGQKSTGFVEKNPIIRFWKSFSQDKDKIEKCLKYAPIFQNGKVANVDIEKEYVNYLFVNRYDRIKKAINNKKTVDEITEEEKHSLLNFADHKVFFHFDFPMEKQWYKQKQIFEFIVDSLNLKLVTEQNRQSFVPQKSLFRTLCSGDDKNDIQFPEFLYKNSYKSFAFTDKEQFNDFLYANAIINKPKMWLKGTNINIYVFPTSYSVNDIDAKDYENFFFENKPENSLFSFDFLCFDDEADKSVFTRFDFVFSDSGGNTTRDLIEIDGIEKSCLLRIKERISEAELLVSKEKEMDLNWSNVKMSLEDSLGHILGKCSVKSGTVVFDKDSSFYQSKMLKVLPLIYTENYYEDKDLLRNLIDKVEFSIRNGAEKDYGNYSLLKYDLKLIMCIQNNQNNKYMEITESKSYRFGVKLGKISKPLKKKINSFEKTYVGLLTRRVATKDDCLKLVNEICEKLTMHEKAWETMCAEVCHDLAEISVNDYDKEKVAFGFFEGYFKYEPTDKKKDFQSRLEKLLSDYEDNEDLREEVEKLACFVEELNNSNEQ